jgi:hypothetical protein
MRVAGIWVERREVGARRRKTSSETGFLQEILYELIGVTGRKHAPLLHGNL